MTIAPMSVYTANSLKEKLLRGIDSEGNIIDMGVVREVLKILENFELSKDDLEETRIGRYVNSMRKRTNDNAVAKQSKSLIKKWQAVVEQAVTTTSVVSGTQSNPGVPSSQISNHRRKNDDAESVANSNCDSNSPIPSALGNGHNAKAPVQVSNATTPSVTAPKSTISLKIKLGKPVAPQESNESSLSPSMPTIKNGPLSVALQAPVQPSSQPEKQQRRIKSTAEIAMELQQKSQISLSSEIKEKLEKQMPLQTLNEPIPAPVHLSSQYGHDRKQRGRKRGPNSTIDYDNPPSPRTALLQASVQASARAALDGGDDMAGRLLSAEKTELVKRFLDTSVTPSSDMPLTPASAQQSITPEPDSVEPPYETKFVFPGDYSKVSTRELYKYLSATYQQDAEDNLHVSDNSSSETRQATDFQTNINVESIRTPNCRLPGITGIPAQLQEAAKAAASTSANQSNETDQNQAASYMDVDSTVAVAESVWTRWEECVTLVSDNADKRPLFILPFVDIPEDLAVDQKSDEELTLPLHQNDHV